MDELAYIIREHNAKFQAELEHLFPLYCVEVNELRAIEVLNRNQNHLSVQKATTSSPDCSGKSYDNECICSALKKEISKLRMEMISKNRKIQALELQVRNKNVFHNICKKRLEQLLYNNKVLVIF
ncbi:hypothetical protein ALC62_05637 [Cyphomyrmex costatus]|uniref:Uncharacterized protein n=1 Tax=Cyphomyrmex costatus TaxID=456900 RepID=A0A195CS88_9HYME|nr:hypothetical protein ALC62_05637 [Cyphomyrmex costatus]